MTMMTTIASVSVWQSFANELAFATNVDDAKVAVASEKRMDYSLQWQGSQPQTDSAEAPVLVSIWMPMMMTKMGHLYSTQSVSEFSLSDVDREQSPDRMTNPLHPHQTRINRSRHNRHRRLARSNPHRHRHTRMCIARSPAATAAAAASVQTACASLGVIPLTRGAASAGVRATCRQMRWRRRRTSEAQQWAAPTSGERQHADFWGLKLRRMAMMKTMDPKMKFWQMKHEHCS